MKMSDAVPTMRPARVSHACRGWVEKRLRAVSQTSEVRMRSGRERDALAGLDRGGAGQDHALALDEAGEDLRVHAPDQPRLDRPPLRAPVPHGQHVAPSA